LTFPLVIFQDQKEMDPLTYIDDGAISAEENLSHPLSISSRDAFYCRPLAPDEEAWDAQSCATSPGVFTDKGIFHATETTLYPPRSDLSRVASIDSDDVDRFAEINPFDSVSRATPPVGQAFALQWAIPTELPEGDYVAWLEVSKEYDQNADYSYGQPAGLPWSAYGVPYRGQPSVVYRVPFTVSAQQVAVALTDTYHGYGDPEGFDGDVRTPDATITTGTPGSGAERLLLTADDDGMYRLKIIARAEPDDIAPAQPTDFAVTGIEPTLASFSFVSPGDDVVDGTVTGYEVRYLAGIEITEDNFEDALPAAVNVEPREAGALVNFTLDGLLPNTNYYVGVRAFDECLNKGPLMAVRATTTAPEPGAVDACFIATAAYGSLMANEVASLRSFRDTFLRTNIVGEMLVGAYYAFGPGVARVVGPSETLRWFARATLRPVVKWVTSFI
jgi:hypothetical protein